MPRKLPDSRPANLWQRMTTRHYGGTRGQSARTPTSQDTGRHHGRGRPSRSSSPSRWGPRH